MTSLPTILDTGALCLKIPSKNLPSLVSICIGFDLMGNEALEGEEERRGTEGEKEREAGAGAGEAELCDACQFEIAFSVSCMESSVQT